MSDGSMTSDSYGDDELRHETFDALPVIDAQCHNPKTSRDNYPQKILIAFTIQTN